MYRLAIGPTGSGDRPAYLSGVVKAGAACQRIVRSSRSWELCFRCLTLVNCYPLTRFTRWCETSQNPLCCSQLPVIMAEDKVITLGPNELPNLVSSYRLDGHNYLQWAQYIRTTLKGCKKLSNIEGNGPPRDDPKFEA
ncbi:hypothetical protein CR513_51579, partial [Mucuna pruriens]